MAHADTPHHVAQMQIDLLRRAGAARRLGLALDLSEMTIRLSRVGFLHTHPGVDERESACLFIEHHYGRRLASEVREYLQGPSKHERA